MSRTLRILDCFPPARGTYHALGSYLATGAILMAFLFATVHRRSVEEIQNYPSFQRYHQLIQVWIEYGYFTHGGLAFKEPASANPTQMVWRSNSLAFLQVAHLLQRINYAVRGGYSYRLMAVHNQGVIWLTAALLALLSMRMAMRLGMTPGRAFVLGLGAQAVYQTFPQNLQAYWELLPTTAIVLVVAAWLLVEEARFGLTGDQSRYDTLRMLAVFLLVWMEPFGTIFLLVTYVLALHLLAPEERPHVPVLRTVVLPALAGLAIFAIQILWVRFWHASVTLWNTGFLERFGLDGSTQYVQGHWDLITRKWPAPNLPVNFWKALFLVSAISLVVVLILRLVTRLPLKSAVFVLCASAGLYVPFAFAAFQAAAIHPYGYDVWLLVPLLLALFAILPASLEAMTKHTGLLVFASILLAWCFAWVQLRAYAMQFPLLN